MSLLEKINDIRLRLQIIEAELDQLTKDAYDAQQQGLAWDLADISANVSTSATMLETLSKRPLQ